MGRLCRAFFTGGVPCATGCNPVGVGRITSATLPRFPWAVPFAMGCNPVGVRVRKMCNKVCIFPICLATTLKPRLETFGATKLFRSLILLALV